MNSSTKVPTPKTPKTPKKKKLSPRKDVRRGNAVVRLLEDIVAFFKELNKITEGTLFMAAPFILKKGWDYAYELYKNRNKASILAKEMNEYMKKFDETNDSNKKTVYRQKLLIHNAAYFALTSKDYVTDAKYLAEPPTGILRHSKRVSFNDFVDIDKAKGINELGLTPTQVNKGLDHLARKVKVDFGKTKRRSRRSRPRKRKSKSRSRNRSRGRSKRRSKRRSHRKN